MQIAQSWIAVEAEDQAEEQAAGTEQHGAAAGGTTQDRHAVGIAGGVLDIVGKSAPGAEHHGVMRPLPKPQSLVAARFGLQEERFVEGQILRQGGEGEVEVVHAYQRRS